MAYSTAAAAIGLQPIGELDTSLPGGYREEVVVRAPAGAAGIVASVLEQQVSVSPTLVISATPDYSIDDVVNGIVTFATVNYASGKGVVLDKLCLRENAGQVPALHIIFFTATPAAGTYTDNAALAWGAGDLANVVGSVSIATGDWVVTVSKAVVTIADLNIPVAVAATSLFALIIAKSAYNAAATGDLLLTGTFKQRL